jgi:hypothetical protein
MARAAAINEVRPVLEEIDKVADVVDKGLDAVEKGTDIASEAVEKGVRTAVEEAHTAVGFVRDPRVAAGIILVVNVAGAAFVTWKLAKRHYTKKFDAELEREIESARAFYNRLNKIDKDGAVLTPEALVKKNGLEAEAAEAMVEYQGNPETGETHRPGREPVDYTKPKGEESPEAEEAAISNIFVEGKPLNGDDWDYEEEVKHRTEDAPYVISQEEFFENEGDHVQTSITYYAGDDTLVDEADKPINDVGYTVGVENLSKFGHGSGDKNVVYIRNPITDIDFEVAYSAGKYAEEVLGFIQHSDRPTNRRFHLKADDTE